MKFLVDANLSHRVVSILREDGWDVSHVKDHGLWNASDPEIAAFAVESKMSVISADSDFSELLALSGYVAPSLVLLRSVDALTPQEQAHLLRRNLPNLVDELAEGSVASLSPTHLRLRRLPLR